MNRRPPAPDHYEFRVEGHLGNRLISVEVIDAPS
jgi:hypothetical protein